MAILRRPATRLPPNPEELLASVAEAAGRFDVDEIAALEATIRVLGDVNLLLAGVPGAQTLLATPGLAADIAAELEPLLVAIDGVDEDLVSATPPDEALNAARRAAKDVLWAVVKDRLAVPDGIRRLTKSNEPSIIAAMTSVHDALASLDRLEVRGRDSLGLHVFVSEHGLDLDQGPIARMLADRSDDITFANRAVRRVGDVVSFVYKESAEIGELGDNTDALRRAIAEDDLLETLLRAPTAQATVLGHTRWASVGIISEPNAHPVNSESIGEPLAPYYVAALNGDVDNYADLAAEAALGFHPTITTDAKVIPALVADRHRSGLEPHDAFLGTVASFEGSVAIALAGADDPDIIRLAQRGSGQALYVGLAEDCYVIASEPYGLVELTPRFIRLDGESPVDPENPASARGQIATLDRKRAGELDGIVRHSYDGRELPVTASDVITAEITTSDIDLAGYPHFLLKEISEAPRSFRTTLRGKLTETDKGFEVSIGDSMPPAVSGRLADGSIRRVIAIGQGTASVAASAFADALREQVSGRTIEVDSRLATELSGFGIEADMSDVLVVAVSQSGTTTDTNRTVDLARERGAAVVGIVNRRNSDLTDKADAVLYTSDGRDVEMSVASTKAFYSQVAAGFLLATAIADHVGRDPSSARRTQRILSGLAALPEAMESVIAYRGRIGEIASRVAPPERYWAIVGSGPNRIAAEEVRIKLSELCYKAIACDSVEDKKHIDLSSEPLILVCAAGLQGSTADDVGKEVAIYRAHKAHPVVVASEGETRFGTTDVIPVPVVEPELGFVLSAVAGHLFGYEAAVAIDELALPLRRLRAAVESEIASDPDGRGAEMLGRLQPELAASSHAFTTARRQHRYDGQLSTTTAVDLALVMRYAAGTSSLSSYGLDFGKIGTPAVVIDDLMRLLTRAIDELTRPIDAIKHQAKTVTVGISRTDESLLHVPLVAETLAAGAPRDSLTYDTLRTLAGVDPVVAEVLGFTRYRIEGDPVADDATISITDRGGIAQAIRSRVDTDPVLRGTKHRVAIEKQVLVTRGRRDDRLIALVPEVKDTQPIGITLLHLRLEDAPDLTAVRAVLHAYRGRFTELRDAVLETESAFDEELLVSVPIADLLVLPAVLLADRWRSTASPP